MSFKNCCTPKEATRSVNVNVNVDVPKIVKYSCITGTLIVGIIFGTQLFKKMLEERFFDSVE